MPQEVESLKFVIIIPAYNEAEFMGKCLDSLLNQSLKPEKIIVVDDGSTDQTPKIIQQYANDYEIIQAISSKNKTEHQPGAKVIQAFKKGLNLIELEDYNIICKFDADLEFPKNYLEKINHHFLSNPKTGLCGGVCSVLKNKVWQIESLNNADHVRGALKAYRVEAFKSISGLSSQMGWDTADEFKLRFKHWQVKVDQSLLVKHYKPTATSYQDDYFKKQGEVFYALRYGLILTFIAALKIASTGNNLLKFTKVLEAYIKASKRKVEYLLSKEEGIFIRQYRWRRIIEKLIP